MAFKNPRSPPPIPSVPAAVKRAGAARTYGDAVRDRNGELQSGGSNAPPVLRVDTATGESTGYPLSQPTNIGRVFVDNSTTAVTFRVGRNQGGTIIKLEPSD